MWSRKSLPALVLIFFSVASLSSAAPGKPRVAEHPGWTTHEYNPGPDWRSKMGQELLRIFQRLPDYRTVSDALLVKQKFRYIFGLMMTRTYYEPNAVKILFIGQDATHIAEAAKQPGTSGFGARVQSMGNHFGVDRGVATTNTFLSTINGQYGAAKHPVVELGADGVARVLEMPYVDNELWLMAHGKDSEIRITRELFWEWMIRNNKDSMKLIGLFGGAAKDSFAEFLIARGAVVKTKVDPARIEKMQMPETRSVPAGGNAEFPVLITKDGEDVYEILLRKQAAVPGEAGESARKALAFSDEIPGKRRAVRGLNYAEASVQAAARKALQDAGQEGIDLMVFTRGGKQSSGMLNVAQLGSYDLDEVYINGVKTNSLKGLPLSDGTFIKDHIAFANSVHPTALSMMKTPELASAAVEKSFAKLRPLIAAGWSIPPDEGMINHFEAGHPYDFNNRADIRPGYFEFGAPDDRRVSAANATRLDKQTIVAGSRNKDGFRNAGVEKAKLGKASSPKDPRDLWSVRPRQDKTLAIYDQGPGEARAKALMESLDRDSIFRPKPGMRVVKDGRDVTFEVHGIDAYNTKTHPGTGFFGHHRGDFDTARALILADPHGIDDWNTARALTGERGQFLHGMMEDVGFGKDYLVLKTAPVGMDGAIGEEWEDLRRKTTRYREIGITEALKSGKIEVILTDGEIAQKEMKRILAKLGVKDKRVINIARDARNTASGLADAAAALGKTITPRMADIPREHLPFWARIWEGTSGDLVIDAKGKGRGGVRALVTPDWVAKQTLEPSVELKGSIAALLKEADANGIRMESEEISKFLARHPELRDGAYRPIHDALSGAATALADCLLVSQQLKSFVPGK